MKVLLLGASGLLGHNVLRKLIERRFDVVCLLRSPDSVRLSPEGWRAVTGSPLDYDILRSAALGCDAVINCVGATDMSMRHYSDFLPANCQLPELLVRLLGDLNITALVHVSTVNTIGYGTIIRPADENEPMRPPFRGSLYADSKAAGESVILSAADQYPDRHIVVLNPGFMVGPFDAKPSSGRLLLAAYRKPLMVAPRGGKSFIYVGDVALAVVNALSQGTSGQRYIITNHRAELSLRDFYALQAETMGYRQWFVTIPDWLLSVAGAVGDFLRALGLKTQLSSANVRQLTVDEHYDNTRACRELGLRETPVDEAIRQFFLWYQKNKI